MSKQSEQILEEQLIVQLQKLGYKYVTIKDERDLLANLKENQRYSDKSSISSATMGTIYTLSF